MAITLKYGTGAPALAGAFAAGLGRRDERNRAQALAIQQEEYRRRQAERDRMIRQQERMQDFSYRTYLENMRQSAYDRRAQEEMQFRAGEAEKGRVFQGGLAAGRERMATQKSTLDYAKSQYEEAQQRMDEIRKQSGGAFRGTVQGDWDELERGLRMVDAAVSRGDLDSSQALMKKTKEIREFLSGFNMERDVIPWSERQGNIFERNGAMWQKSTEQGGKDTFIDFVPDDPNLTEEDIRAGKSHRFRYFGGKLHQKIMGRQGSEWKPIDTGGGPIEEGTTRSKVYSAINKRANEIMSSKTEPGSDTSDIPYKDAQAQAIRELYPGGIPFETGSQQLPEPGLIGYGQYSRPQGSQQYQQPIGPQPITQSTGIPQVTSEAELQKLPPGSQFMAPDGQIRVVPPQNIPAPSVQPDTQGTMSGGFEGIQYEETTPYQQILERNKQQYQETMESRRQQFQQRSGGYNPTQEFIRGISGMTQQQTQQSTGQRNNNYLGGTASDLFYRMTPIESKYWYQKDNGIPFTDDVKRWMNENNDIRDQYAY